MSLESYVQRGVDDEWYASWPVHSLRAGTVPYRSYGAWYVAHPLSGNYDICNNAYCQVWEADEATSVRDAARYTSGFMLESGGDAARSEYSAQNNGLGTTDCPDCYCGSPSTGWGCLYDSVGCGYPRNGHGRGMSQWGTKYWADGGQSWTWMVNHYYNNVERPDPNPRYNISSPIRIDSASISPGNILPGGTFTITITATNFAADAHNQILVGASTCNPYCLSDPAHDIKATLNPGTNQAVRQFQAPITTTPGTYDLRVSLRFDVNENSAIDSDPIDLTLDTETFPGQVAVGRRFTMPFVAKGL